jgi:prepilin-type N-terminal cleavage/methylation domain-containing protein
MLRFQRGFTLVEVLVATAIVVTIAAGTAQLLAIAIHDEVAARQQLAMTASASTKLDEIAATVANGSPPGAVTGALDRAVSGFSDVVVVAGASFERRWVIAPLTGYGARAVAVVLRVVPVAVRSARELEVSTIVEAAVP